MDRVTEYLRLMKEFVAAKNSASFTVKQIFEKKAQLDLLFTSLTDEETDAIAEKLQSEMK